MAADYLSQRLLSRQKSLSPRLDKIRQIAWQLALDDADRKLGYTNNINSLSLLIARRRPVGIEQWFRINLRLEYQDQSQQCDLLTASICTGRLVTFHKLVEQEDLILKYGRTVLLGGPYTAAAFADNFTLIDRLLCKSEKQGLDSHHIKHIITRQILPAACKYSSPKTLETLLASSWCSFLTEPDAQAQRELVTPRLKIFDVIQRFVDPPGDKGLATLLLTAASRGWEKMTLRLLELGASPDDELFYDQWRPYRKLPLSEACSTGSLGTVAHLLQFGARVGKYDLEKAAKRGQFGMVKLLVEHGADVNPTDYEHPPIVSAIMLEHTEMFRFLVGRGATLGDNYTATVQKAKEGRVESMVELIESTFLDPGGGVG